MKRVLLIDFDDSFIFNVAQELEELGLRVDLISWKKINSISSYDLLALGPGPGHPREYEDIFPLIRKWILSKRPLFGVCLGHQIFWTLMGAEVRKSFNPVHGQKVRLHLDPEWKKFLSLSSDPWVQRYNSLAVDEKDQYLVPNIENFIQNQEILISKSSQVLTYQFHPESIGTSYPQAFFRPLLRDFI